jgi:hypothetical protein
MFPSSAGAGDGDGGACGAGGGDDDERKPLLLPKRRVGGKKKLYNVPGAECWCVARVREGGIGVRVRVGSV